LVGADEGLLATVGADGGFVAAGAGAEFTGALVGSAVKTTGIVSPAGGASFFMAVSAL
jgi:hypothetical protein